MNNKYYDKYINEDVNDDILEERPSSFEDHFWHMLCLSVYYKNKGDEYLEKMCIQKACDLNYAYSAMLYFDKKEVLPSKYKVYISQDFQNNMKDDKVEARIKYFNKKNARSKNLGFLWYSLSGLAIIPVMLFLVFVCKMDTTIAAILSIALMFVGQFVYRYFQKRSMYSRVRRKIERKLEEYLKYYDRFAYLFKNELYIDLIRAKDGSESEKEIIEKLKKGESK